MSRVSARVKHVASKAGNGTDHKLLQRPLLRSDAYKVPVKQQQTKSHQAIHRISDLQRLPDRVAAASISANDAQVDRWIHKEQHCAPVESDS